MNTLSVQCHVASGQRLRAEFDTFAFSFQIPLSFQEGSGGYDWYAGTLSNLGIPYDGSSYLTVVQDYTASTGNGAVCYLDYVAQLAS